MCKAERVICDKPMGGRLKRLSAVDGIQLRVNVMFLRTKFSNLSSRVSQFKSFDCLTPSTPLLSPTPLHPQGKEAHAVQPTLRECRNRSRRQASGPQLQRRQGLRKRLASHVSALFSLIFSSDGTKGDKEVGTLGPVTPPFLIFPSSLRLL